MFFALLPFLLVLALGCSAEDPKGETSTRPDPYEPLAAPDVNSGFQLALEVDVPSGTEGTWCQHFVLPPEDHDVTRYESKYTPISHHLIVYQTNLTASDPALRLKAFDCDANDRFSGLAGFHYGSQIPEDRLVFPPGIGKKQIANEVALIEYHAINTSDAALRAEARVNFWYAAEPIRTVADTLFFYQPIIFIPPHAESIASMHCAIPNDVSLLHAVPHMHRRGVGFEAILIDSSGASLGSFLQTSSYEPPTTSFDPEFPIRAGQAIEFTCRFRNDEGREIVEGPSAVRNEMCVFVATYYTPSGELVDGAARVCEAAGSGPKMSGAADCRATVACVDALSALEGADPAALRLAGDRCFNSACHSGYERTLEYLGCRYSNCEATCVTPAVRDEASCEACVREHCPEPARACDANRCG